ncbi:MAG TPA: C40 family peptidase [Marmoricola sp.]|nr:C40 family peptidase [Marmoricola sp.]
MTGRTVVAGLATAAVVLGCGAATSTPATTTPATSLGTTPTALARGRDAWVSVSVATLWRSPDSPRPVDAPALADPVRMEAWLAAMSLAQRRDLAGRVDSEALLGDRVRVVRLRPGWAKVVVPSQPTPLDARGYPGWVPRRQLSAVAPVASGRTATVLARTPWLRADTAAAPRLFRVSFGTRLPVLGSGPHFVRVSVPGGTTRRLATGVVTVHDRGTPALAPTRAGLVGTATSFVGLDYLWGGLSGFGVDCSGLTWLDYRVHGLRIPRDAAPQSSAGTHVGTPRRGDLLFYASGGVVHHVAMYAGDGRMVHAPHTGSTVQVAPTATLADEYVGARRYLP